MNVEHRTGPMTTERILNESNLPKELIRKMVLSSKACAAKCPTCGIGAGHWCDHRLAR